MNKIRIELLTTIRDGNSDSYSCKAYLGSAEIAYELSDVSKYDALGKVIFKLAGAFEEINIEDDNEYYYDRDNY